MIFLGAITTVGLVQAGQGGEVYAASAKIRSAKVAKRKAKRKPPQKPKPKKRTKRSLNIGGGIFNIYPPMPTIHATFQPAAKIQLGMELGYIVLPFDEFAGSSSYFGVDSKYFLSKKLFTGFGVGRRAFDIITKSNFNHDLGTEEISWRREVTQFTFSTRLGWYSEAKAGDAFYISGGLLMPFGSSLRSSRDIESISGVPNSVLDEEEDQKAGDVTSVTNAAMFQVEIKYLINVK